MTNVSFSTAIRLNFITAAILLLSMTLPAYAESIGTDEVFVGSREVWESDSQDFLYDIIPAMPGDGFARFYCTRTADSMTLNYKRTYSSSGFIFEEDSISMTWLDGMWEASIRIAPSERILFSVESGTGDISPDKSFTVLPDVWHDHYAFGFLDGWGGGDVETYKDKLDAIGGTFVNFILSKYNDSSINGDGLPYRSPFSDCENLTDLNGDGEVNETDWGFGSRFGNHFTVEGAWNVFSQTDPAGEHYSYMMQLYHMFFGTNGKPISKKVDLDAYVEKLSAEYLAKDPWCRGLTRDGEWANPVNEFMTLWDENGDGSVSRYEEARSLCRDILFPMRKRRPDLRLGLLPNYTYHNINGFLSLKLWGFSMFGNHPNMNAKDNQPHNVYDMLSQHYLKEAGIRPIVGAGVAFTAGDCAAFYTLHNCFTYGSDGKVAKKFYQGYAEQILYSMLHNPMRIAAWAPSVWKVKPDFKKGEGFDDQEKEFTRRFTKLINPIPYIGGLKWIGGNVYGPHDNQGIGTKPPWFNYTGSAVVGLSMQKQPGSMWQLIISNSAKGSVKYNNDASNAKGVPQKNITITISDEFFHYLGTEHLVAFKANSGKGWNILTRSDIKPGGNVFTVKVPSWDVTGNGLGDGGMAIYKIGLPVEALGMPSEDSGFTDATPDLSEIKIKHYDPYQNIIDCEIYSYPYNQIAQFYLNPKGPEPQITLNGESVSYTRNTYDSKLADKIGVPLTDNRESAIFYATARIRPEKPVKVIAGTDMRETDPSFTPDGKYMVFTRRDQTTKEDLWLYNMETGEETVLLATPENERNASFSPDGRYVAFNHDPNSNGDVWVMDFSTKEYKRLTDSTNNEWQPCFDADSLNILYSGKFSYYYTLFSVNHETGVRKEILTDGNRWLRYPKIDSSGNLMVYGSHTMDYRIMLKNRSTGETKQVGRGEWPVLSPDGSLVAYCMPKGGVCVIELATGREWPVPGGEKGVKPAFTVDGKNLVFEDLSRGNGDIVMASAAAPLTVSRLSLERALLNLRNSSTSQEQRDKAEMMIEAYFPTH